MSSTHLLFLLISLTTFSECQQSSWFPKFLELKEGEDASFTCQADDLGYFDVIRLVKCKRNSGDGCEDDGIISENSHLKDQFAETSRYHVIFNATSSKLTISDVKGSDAGKIKCQILSKLDYSTATLVVKSRAKNMMFLIEDQKGDLKYVEGTSMKQEGDEHEDVPTLTLSSRMTRTIGCYLETFIEDKIKSLSLKLHDKILEDTTVQRTTANTENMLAVALKTKSFSVQDSSKIFECKVRMEKFQEESSKIKLNITMPSRIFADDEGYMLHLHNNSAHLNNNNYNNTKEGNQSRMVLYELMLHVVGNPKPQVELKVDGYEQDHIIQMKEQSLNIFKVKISYMPNVRIEGLQKVSVKNFEGRQEVKFRLNDRKRVKLIEAGEEYIEERKVIESFQKELRSSCCRQAGDQFQILFLILFLVY